MKILFSWLCDYLKTDFSVAEIAQKLTESIGIEVSSIHPLAVKIPGIIAGKIISSVPHPHADRLSICQVNDGTSEYRQIVCGATNYQVGDIVPVALPSATLPNQVKIKATKLRGIMSQGMMCSAQELDILSDQTGLWILPEEIQVGTPLSEIFTDDFILEIGVTPDASHCLSHQGLARELSSFLFGDFIEHYQSEQLNIVAQNSLDNGVVGAFYSVYYIDNISIHHTPLWLKKRLNFLGSRSINNIVDITNFVMFDMGQPLHAFDAGKVTGKPRLKYAHAGEKFLALNNQEYILNDSDIVVVDDTGVIALAGVIGGKKTAISESTTSIFLESAYFPAHSIRQTANRLGIMTNASYYFEKGTPYIEGTILASKIAIKLINDLASGVLKSTFVSGKIPEKRMIALRSDRVKKLLGIEITEEEIQKLLQQIFLKRQGEFWEIPPWRHDLCSEIDLIEEIATLYGIQNIPINNHFYPISQSKFDKEHMALIELSDKLVNWGFHEIRTDSLRDSKYQEYFYNNPLLEVKNPMGEKYSVLRGSIIPGLLDRAIFNLNKGISSMNLFEIGRIYESSQYLEVPEQKKLGLLMFGKRFTPHWSSPNEDLIDFFDLKGLISQLGHFEFRDFNSHSLFCAQEIFLPDISPLSVGYFGILAEEIVQTIFPASYLKIPILIAEISIDYLLQNFPKYDLLSKGISKFPAIKKDIALIVDEKISYQCIKEIILAIQEENLRCIFPFDIFRDNSGKKIPQKKKSLAISLIFQNFNRTLTHEEINRAVALIIEKLASDVSAEIRC